MARLIADYFTFCSIAVNKATYKRSHLIGGLLAVSDDEPLGHHGGDHDSMQSGMELQQ